MKSVLLILAMALGVEPGRDLLQPEPTTLPAVFGKTFVGRLGGKHEVRMHLDRKNGSLSGRYSYVNVEDSLLGLKGTIQSSGAFTLDEFDSGRRTGGFRGTLVRQILKGGSLLKLSGTWESAEGRKPLPFELVEEHLMVDGGPVVYSTAAIEEENAKLGYEIGAAYPQFEGRAAVVQKLNAAIKALVTREAAAFRKNAKEWARENAADAKPGDPASASQMSVSYAVLAADHGVLSLRFSTFQYFPGTVHPSHGIEVFNYSLREARALKLEDLFTPGSAYLKTLADYCIEELQLEDEWRKGAEPKRDNYTRWNLTRDGLLITFDEYQVAPYAAGIPEVAIPYGELSAMLRKNGPAAPFANR